MLRDYLLAWCQNEIDNSVTGCCGQHCDNDEYCEHDCDNDEYCEHDCDRCLDQVHWYPSKPGRADYTCSNLLLRYVVRFTEKYSQQISSALTFVDDSLYPQYNILSIGCGGTPDLMAFEEASGKPIYYKGYDRNPFWHEIHAKIEQYANEIEGLDVKLCQRDIFDVFSDRTPTIQQYNVVIIQYLLSHLYNTGQADKTLLLFESIIRNILARRLLNSPFLIIITDVDSMNKGRCNWYAFLNMLEDAGYCGTAYARSAFATGDLGESRWNNYWRKNSPYFNNIRYEYFHNGCVQDGAQLIIELR